MVYVKENESIRIQQVRSPTLPVRQLCTYLALPACLPSRGSRGVGMQRRRREHRASRKTGGAKSAACSSRAPRDARQGQGLSSFDCHRGWAWVRSGQRTSTSSRRVNLGATVWHLYRLGFNPVDAHRSCLTTHGGARSEKTNKLIGMPQRASIPCGVVDTDACL